MIALVVIHDFHIHQINVKTVFLYGSLLEEIYMTQPQSFVDPQQRNNVCKLLKSLYGLKQSP